MVPGNACQCQKVILHSEYLDGTYQSLTLTELKDLSTTNVPITTCISPLYRYELMRVLVGNHIVDLYCDIVGKFPLYMPTNSQKLRTMDMYRTKYDVDLLFFYCK